MNVWITICFFLIPGLASSREEIRVRLLHNQSRLNLESGVIESKRILAPESMILIGDKVKVNGIQVPRKVHLVKRDSAWDVIGYIPLKEYLTGVLSAEVPESWPDETLKAQAIAAHTYVQFMKLQRSNLDFDVESTVKDQVYKESKSKKLRAIINEVKDLVILDSSGDLIKAYYHSECGGATSPASLVFGDIGYSDWVKDPYCSGKKWEYRLPVKKFTEVFNSKFDIQSVAHWMGRNLSIKMIGRDAEAQVKSAVHFRSQLGTTRLKSTWFESKNDGINIIFKGQGYGHGVGLCQMGSRVMGRLGKSYQEIISFYYPKTQLAKLQNNLAKL